MTRKTLYLWMGAIALAAMAGMAQAADAALDRAALLKLADTYLAALVAHDPGKVPLAGDVKMVENVTRIKPGEGLWKTATSAPIEFKIAVRTPGTGDPSGWYPIAAFHRLKSTHAPDGCASRASNLSSRVPCSFLGL